MNTHHTKLKGDIAEQLVTLDLMKKGYNISRPLTECAPYDLIADSGSKLYRVQVKYRDNNTVPYRSTWSDRNGIHVVNLDSSKFDIIALVSKEHIVCYVLPEMMGKKINYVEPLNFTKYYWYEDFLDIKDYTPEKRQHVVGTEAYTTAINQIREANYGKGPIASNESLTAEKLTELVWSMPTVEVAKLYDVSDSAIGKMCKKLGVNKPPRGYWRKVATNTVDL